MFAKRTGWELSSNKISILLESLRGSGKTVLDLTASNPTCCGFSYSSAEINAALNHPQNMIYAPSAQGSVEARKIVARMYAEKGLRVSPDRIFLTASTSEAYSFLFRLLADPSETVLFPRPSYPLFQFLGNLNDLQLDSYSLVYRPGAGWRINLDELETLVSSQTKALVLVNPNNPTGSFINKDEWMAVNALCQRHKLAIICDEVFQDFVFDENTSSLSLAGNEENLTFVLNGLSKSLGLPQMKLSWIVVNGPETMVKEAAARLEVIADTYLSVNTPVQNALHKWVDLKPAIHKEIISRIRNNRKFLLAAGLEQKNCECLQAEGGWYAVIKLPGHCQEEDFVLSLLEQKYTFVHPGYFFDFEEEPFIVLSLLPEEKIFQTGVKHIVGQVDSL